MMNSDQSTSRLAFISLEEAGLAALAAARRLRLIVEDSIDCAVDFVFCLIVLERERVGVTFPGMVAGALSKCDWLAACNPTTNGLYCARSTLARSAHWFARRYRRAILNRREAGSLEDFHFERRAADDPGPEARMMQRLGRAVIDAAVLKLKPKLQEVFILRRKGLSLRQIAAFTGRTPHAIEQAAYTGRRRLQQILLQNGYSERELRELLIPPPVCSLR